MSRPLKINNDVITRIAQAVGLGATYEHAANYGGVSYACLRNWIIRAEAEKERRESASVKVGTAKWEKEQIFVELFDAIKKAEGTAVIGWLAKIEKAASEGTWQAAAWKAERRYPDDYGRQKIEHSGNVKITSWRDELAELLARDKITPDDLRAEYTDSTIDKLVAMSKNR